MAYHHTGTRQLGLGMTTGLGSVQAWGQCGLGVSTGLGMSTGLGICTGLGVSTGYGQPQSTGRLDLLHDLSVLRVALVSVPVCRRTLPLVLTKPGEMLRVRDGNPPLFHLF